MKSILSALGLLLLPTFLSAQDDDPTPEQIQQFLRISYAHQEGALTGQLRSNETGLKVPFGLTLFDNTVSFRFREPVQNINLSLTENGTQLREVTRGSNAPVPPERYHQKVRGTEINYEDLAMRFLYWPKPKLMLPDRIKTQKCWVLRVFNPGSGKEVLGPYRFVDIWIAQKSGALMKMQGFGLTSGELIKEFTVVKVQKDGEGYILKQMRIDTFEPGEDRFPIARTYLDIDKPVKE